MERPPPDPIKLLSAWMEWEHGGIPPGRTMATLKTGGLRELLEVLAAEAERLAAEAGPGPEGVTAEDAGPATETWKPVV